MRVADFTSSLYLGMRHAGGEFTAWPALTSGRPAVLDPPAGAAAARHIAARAGAELAALTRSTLHGLNDCMELLAGQGTVLAVDSGIYPVGRWAVQRAAGIGIPVAWVGHHDLARLRYRLERLTDKGLRPVVVADGFCTGCGRAYPLAEAAALADGVTVLLDDTQALGILGPSGGGSVAQAGIPHDNIVTVSSLAKAFGVPVACVTGPAAFVERLRTIGSALHSSPPSRVDIAAAVNAVRRDAAEGDRLRSALAVRVRTLRRKTLRSGLAMVGGLFPVQSTPALTVDKGQWLLDRLADGGLRAVLRQTCHGGSAVTLIVTATHPPAAIDLAAHVLGSAWRELHPEVCHAS